MNLIKRFLGSEAAQEKVTLAPGELWISRAPQSPKSGRSTIFSDAEVTLASAGYENEYEIVVRPSADDEEDDELSRLEKERSFLVDSALRVAYFDLNGRTVVSWVDPEGDAGDRYEFVCAPSVTAEALQKFDIACRTVQYQRKYHRSPPNRSALEEFDYDSLIEQTKPITPVPVAEKATEVKGTVIKKSSGVALCVYDIARELFVQQVADTTASIIETEPFTYVLAVADLKTSVTEDLNVMSNDEHKSFIFNVLVQDKLVTYLIQFETLEALQSFSEDFAMCLWQARTKITWKSSNETDREYIMDSYTDVEPDKSMELSDDEDYEEELDAPPTFDTLDHNDDANTFTDSKEKNSALEVGHAKDRTYVVRGSKIGVFKQGPQLDYVATIEKVANSEGVNINPGRILLHEQDTALVMQGDTNPDHLYRMDIEYGKVVDEWDVGKDLTSYNPVSKFAQTTGETNLVGTSSQSVFRIDPRLAGTKVVQDSSKYYSSKVGFTASATTGDGNVAIGSKSGEIRLYNKLGKMAKTHLPSMGDEILALDVTADGKWLIATFKTYLLLIETTTDENNGFTKAFPEKKKPRPRRLQISPENAAFMFQESGKPISFTPARFDTGPDAKEQTIVTATGPYVVTWNLKGVLRGEKNPYLIKRYSSTVTADNFQYGSDKKVIVALENDVGVVSRKALRRPTRKSLLS